MRGAAGAACGPLAEGHLKAAPARAAGTVARADAWSDELESLYVGLVRTYHQTVLAYLYRLDPVIQQAEDLTQETFLKAYLALPRVGVPDSPRAWLLRIASNTAIDHNRRRHGVRCTDLDGVAAPEPGPGVRLERGEAVRRALASLAPGDRSVLILFAHLGLQSAEVGEVLGISPAAARKRRQRAREAFSLALERLDA